MGQPLYSYLVFTDIMKKEYSVPKDTSREIRTLRIGKNKAFERRYTQKFRQIAGNYGEFTHYEDDHCARDIGLHLTRKHISKDEIPSPTLCWFQLKGITKESLSEQQFHDSKEIKLSLEVKHLVYWYLQRIPTYLALYIESIDKFLVIENNTFMSTCMNGVVTIPARSRSLC